MSLNESIVEDAALEWFGELGYAVGHGPQLAPGEPAAVEETVRASGMTETGGVLREGATAPRCAIQSSVCTVSRRSLIAIATFSNCPV